MDGDERALPFAGMSIGKDAFAILARTQRRT